MKHKLDILFEDDHFIIINKDANLLSIPDRYHPDLPSLKLVLRKIYGEIFVLHRLDFETSGVICFGKKHEVQAAFTEMQIANKVTKQYLAIVDGVLIEKEQTIDVPLLYQDEKTIVAKKETKAKEATTIVESIEEFASFSVLRCHILNGRTHQIRVHLAHIGHPLAIDKKYGYNDKIMLSDIKRKFRRKKDEDERPLVGRQPLHAEHIAFVHPFTQEQMSIAAPLKKDMKALLNQLRKHGK